MLDFPRRDCPGGIFLSGIFPGGIIDRSQTNISEDIFLDMSVKKNKKLKIWVNVVLSRTVQDKQSPKNV